MNQSIVKKFVIRSLFGNKDIDIDIPRPCCILIGENGLGKTTVLNIINLVLNCQFQKLSKYKFQQIELEIVDTYFTFSKEEIDSYAMAYGYHSEDMDLSFLSELLKILKNHDPLMLTLDILKDAIIRRPYLRRKYGNIRLDMLGHLLEFIKAFPNIFTFIHLCQRHNFYIEYLTTYRRIEADLNEILEDYRKSRNNNEKGYRQLFFEDEDNTLMLEQILKDKSSIQFGMKDIENMLKRLLQKISETSVMGFSNVSGGMLSKLIEKDLTVKDTVFNKSEVQIVLQRSGRSLSPQEQERIIEIIENGEIYDNKYLVYFLSQLITVYKSQRVFDTALKGFVNACNEFLVDKKFYYNESRIKIGLYYINDEKYSEEISLNSLSSGEKQLVSIMAKVYLKLDSDVILLIDEPELSLSIRWQKSFIPTLLKAESCRQIIAVTHSPFIFSNELEDNAIGSLEYVKYGNRNN